LGEIVIVPSRHPFPAQQEHGEIEDIKKYFEIYIKIKI
jgi:hypothetical protein